MHLPAPQNPIRQLGAVAVPNVPQIPMFFKQQPNQPNGGFWQPPTGGNQNSQFLWKK